MLNFSIGMIVLTQFSQDCIAEGKSKVFNYDLSPVLENHDSSAREQAGALHLSFDWQSRNLEVMITACSMMLMYFCHLKFQYIGHILFIPNHRCQSWGVVSDSQTLRWVSWGIVLYLRLIYCRQTATATIDAR